MTSYKLTYFNARGKAEPTRLLFAVAEVPYEDVRVTHEQWASMKSSSPFGQLPLLEINGKTYCQSNAFARYLAHKFKLAGKTELEHLQVDMAIDCFDDIAKPLAAFKYEADESRKAALEKKLKEEQLPTFLASLEKMLKSNNGGDGFFVGDGLTWADLAFLSVYTWVQIFGHENMFDKAPKLKALKGRIEKIPKVAAWIAKRPVTEF